MKPDMDGNESKRSFVPPPKSSLSFLYNYNNNPCPGMEVKTQGLLQEKKKRLTSNQIESLERSFLEEIKLDTDRKMKLSRELGLQPRQIAVWFQNRRTRWKAKRLEHLYLALKQEFDHISNEKQKLQEEVMKLKAMLREQALRTQISAGDTEMSGREVVESMSEMLCGSNKPRGMINNQQIADVYCSFTAEDYSNAPPPHWAVVPYCP